MGLLSVLTGRPSIQPADYIIEYSGRYWTGTKFVKGNEMARCFRSELGAWKYVDETFLDEVAEDCTIVKKTRGRYIPIIAGS